MSGCRKPKVKGQAGLMRTPLASAKLARDNTVEG